ncbi:MAG: hypothetical protein OXE51_06455, partial [Gammaproteobacteria bacterium]|nr:hypothetical protein [Gammaproteobacteria bacterium]
HKRILHLNNLSEFWGPLQCLPFLAHRVAAVTAFAKKIGIAPGIVVGRMQHDGHLPRNYLNKLKVRYQWT